MALLSLLLLSLAFVGTLAFDNSRYDNVRYSLNHCLVCVVDSRPLRSDRLLCES
jgi:hypothetical protein